MSFAEIRSDDRGATFLFLGGRQFQAIGRDDGIVWAGAINAITTDADTADFNKAFDLVTQANPIYITALKKIVADTLDGHSCAIIADKALKDGGQ